jgi:cytoskeletal protein CcmA (bactofilin family)
MFGRRKQTPGRIDTLLGKTARVVGDVEFAGGLHLDGKVIGNIRGAADGKSQLSISEHGSVEGTVEAGAVILNGTVNGDIFARERIQLGSQARVNGNVSYGIIEMAPGAVITGRLMPMGSLKAVKGGDELQETAARLLEGSTRAA